MKTLIPHNEIHTYLLDIMKDIDRFCTENGIRYSMAYGTLIGAVRHKGFIPWDDDIDLLMPRPDFERFTREYNREPDQRYRVVFQTDGPDECFQHIFAKVHDSWTTIDQGNARFGLFVDIFPVDGKPEDIGTQKKMEKKLTHYAHRLNICETKFNPFNTHQPLPANIAAHILGPKHYIKAAENIMFRYGYEGSVKAGAVSMTRNGTREVFDRSLFESYTTLDFEGCRFQAFADWKTFLVQQYGDYMQLPPLKDRRSHNIKAYRIK